MADVLVVRRIADSLGPGATITCVRCGEVAWIVTPAQRFLAPPEVKTSCTHCASEREIEAMIVELTSDETGYSPDLLDLDLDLLGDLGIDSVKQKEVFRVLMEHFAIKPDEALQLKDYPTLRHTIDFIRTQLQSPYSPSA